MTRDTASLAARALLAMCFAGLLAGCATAKLGAILYCPYGEACSLQKLPEPKPETLPTKPDA